MAKKFIRGAFELEKSITDREAFSEKHLPALKKITAWAEDNGVYVNIGFTIDDCCDCDFVVMAQTVQLCRGYVAELKAMLKAIFPKMQLRYSASGDRL